ncbi:MAG: hypothetical protein IKK28_00810, partial [Mogibacterium sp.]|nr:hypothetical protein [Mogibacterium sp.]
GGVSDAPAVDARRNKQYLQIAALSIHFDNHTADRISVLHDAIGFAAVDRSLYRLLGDDLLILLKMVVSSSKLLQRAVVERFLIVQNELVTI